MLLQFSVQNYLSIESQQEISFVASKLKDDPSGLLASSGLPSAAILPSIILYGANASGKSNLIKALGYMRSAVLFSQTRWDPDGGTDLVQFALGAEGDSGRPSIFEANFIFEDTRYQYAFSASSQAILSESLYSYPNQHRQMLFHRHGMNFEWGRALKGQREAIKGLTRNNSLFVSAAAQNGHELLSKIRDAFGMMGADLRPFVEGRDLDNSLNQNEFDARIADYLSKIGTGVSSFRRQEKALDEKQKQLMNALANEVKKIYSADITFPDTVLEKNSWIELGHGSKDGRTIYFKAEQESAGTRRLLGFLGRMFAVLDSGSLMVIDEMSNSLHTKACELIFSLFSNKSTNPRGAQLLAATHDTNLLRSSLLRRDQIYFVEKDMNGASHVYPLTDIKTKKSDDIEKGYIQGRFGAVPFAGSADKIYGKTEGI